MVIYAQPQRAYAVRLSDGNYFHWFGGPKADPYLVTDRGDASTLLERYHQYYNPDRTAAQIVVFDLLEVKN